MLEVTQRLAAKIRQGVQEKEVGFSAPTEIAIPIAESVIPLVEEELRAIPFGNWRVARTRVGLGTEVVLRRVGAKEESNAQQMVATGSEVAAPAPDISSVESKIRTPSAPEHVDAATGGGVVEVSGECVLGLSSSPSEEDGA